MTNDRKKIPSDNPDLPSYGDYDQLMRLDEWQARGDLEEGA